MEEWRIVEDGYKVSNLGEVFSLRRRKLLTKFKDRYGYYYVGLRINGKTKFCKVHRLVAKAFLPDYSEDLQVNHINEDKTDNSLSNLEMCNNLYNCTYGSRKTKLAKKVLQFSLDGVLIKEWNSTREIERTLSFPNSAISSCCRGYQKDSHSGKVYPVHQAFGYIWKYK